MNPGRSVAVSVAADRLPGPPKMPVEDYELPAQTRFSLWR